MAFSFEKLEQRHLLTGLNVGIDGPTIVRSGEEVTYVVHVTNEYGIVTDIQPEFVWTEFERVRLSLDGQPWPLAPSTQQTFRLAPNATAVFEVSGRVTEGDFFVIETEMMPKVETGRSTGASLSAYVFDRFADESTIGSEIRTLHLEQGFRISSSVHSLSLIHTEDFDGDGLIDIAVDFINGADDVGGTFRYTVYGSEVVDRDTPAAFFARLKNSVPVDSRLSNSVPLDADAETHDIDIGDVDGDGYDDIIRTNQRAANNSGTATIFFGPDLRENYVIFGSHRVGRSGGSSFFGMTAGAIGDVDGDGFNEFFVVDRHRDINVFFGRDFGRNPTGDLNADGTVDFSDFLILAENFNRQTNDRALGELDGDGRVTFLDLLLLAENFGKSV